MAQGGPEDLLFDIETDGLLDELTRIHILAIKRRGGGPAVVYSDVSPNAVGSVAEGVQVLQCCTEQGGRIAGHNVIKFDIPAIQKLHPTFSPVQSQVLDTLTISRLIYADLTTIDVKLVAQDRLPKNLMFAHSLKAWGCRLGNYKDEYSGGWKQWNLDMETYCVQDVEVTATLFERFMQRIEGLGVPDPVKALPQFSHTSVILEHEVAFIMARQERRGFAFDEGKAVKLYTMLLKERLELEAKLATAFKPRWFKESFMVPKRDNKKAGYTQGCGLTKIKLVPFNPSSL